MAFDIYLHNRKIESVFELLGSKENDFTYSVGWTLSRSSTFLDQFLCDLFPNYKSSNNLQIHLQEHSNQQGFTDIEIIGQDLHVIVEAKRGWTLPDEIQLGKYSSRIDVQKKHVAILALAECSHQYVKLKLTLDHIRDIPIFYRNWEDIVRLTEVGRSNAEKRLLTQLRKYLRRHVRMQKQESNWVYVVSLSYSEAGGGFSYIDIVAKMNRYFHPFGGQGGWPVDPPNYLGFRYDGRLQRIHHVDGYEVFCNFHDYFPEFPDHEEDTDSIIYMLGPPIIPSSIIKTGKIYGSGRVWAMLDTLLTCDTVADARDLSKQRLK